MGIWRHFKGRNFPFAKRVLLLLTLLVGFAITWLINTSSFHIWARKKYAPNPDSSPCVVLWWTDNGLGKYEPRPILCGYNACFSTGDRRYLSRAKAILFYGSNVQWNDLPLPRKPGQIWALLHEESPRNVPVFMYEDIIQHFNYTSTFSRYSDFRLTTRELPSLQAIVDPRFVVPLGRKNVARANLAPAIFLQSDCLTMSARTDYVVELMKYLSIDSYGDCLKNREIPESLQTDFLNHLYSNSIKRFIGQYKFMISIENGICEDYITEKYWRPLIAGVVPIYFGSPTIRDWEPHNRSAIYISDFEGPKELAKYILELDRNDTEYVKYLRHKYNQINPVTNERLSDEMFLRTETVDLFANLECQVLEAMWAQTPKSKMANRLHYNCPLPIPYPAMESQQLEINFWKDIILKSSCLSKALNELLHINRNFTQKELDQLTDYKAKNELC
ncbi:PREDICTED: alpha-(1,3)-fucosyltransferase B isoform X1 [Rhagoletis zephyria]|uniref:alpha-(1,3)-fucosyltransferase B isoform X1 n=1 Tax=Rhagoletis zephyria TaxID=28612 RepID=UPI0008119094|nr:PREDICTED: alpha-(1,3)-fucosyltransferase B isoform X1 [Rhagoletis zephyria]